eukprot:GHVR01010267.1.p1 GENE.GHVR01010267.1~~GHVR01010267.1.p1  ORF type:complete len:100 (-),score=8.05 GHVR01010267.1:123-422(-)
MRGHQANFKKYIRRQQRAIQISLAGSSSESGDPEYFLDKHEFYVASQSAEEIQRKVSEFTAGKKEDGVRDVFYPPTDDDDSDVGEAGETSVANTGRNDV